MLSIVVSWRDRVELRLALPGLVAAAAAVGGDVTIVNFGGEANLLAEQILDHRSHVTVVEAPGHQYFNKSKAHNIGIACSANPYLFFSDCDILLEASTVAELFSLVAKAPGTFGTLVGVTESERNSRGGQHVTRFGYTLVICTADGRELRIVDSEEDAATGSRNAPGLLLARRSDLLSIGGFNSRLVGWGWEDQDMIARLTLGAGLSRVLSGTAVHLSHDDKARVAHYPLADRWESRDRMFRQALANYDCADFTGTYELDRAETNRRVLAPVMP